MGKYIHRKKAISCAILAALMFCIASGCKQSSVLQLDEILKYKSFRDVPGVTNEEIAAIENFQKQGIVFVYGTIPSTETFLDASGELRGFTVLFCDWLTELFGIPFEPKLYEWSDMLAGLESGEIDFTGELTATDERRLTYMMTDAIAGRSVKYMRIADSAPLSYIAVSRPLRYAFLRDTVTYNEIVAMIDDDFEPVFADSYEEAYSLLKSQKIDAFIDEDTGEAPFDIYGDVVAEAFYPLIYGPVSLATGNKKNRPIIELVQKILQNGGSHYLTELYHAGKYEYRKQKLAMSLTKEELVYIKSNPVVNFVAEYDNYPISFYNVRDKEWQGVCFDVLKEVEELTNLSFKLANDEKAEWPVILKMLETGEASIISELIRTPEREGIFLWPKAPLMTDYYALLSKSEYRNISIDEVLYMKVALAENTAHAELFAKYFPSHKNAVTYGSVDVAFDALQRGEADMMMASLNQLLILTNYQELAGYKANIVFDYPFESSFGFYKGDAILCSIVEKSLRLIDTKGITAGWTRKTYDYREKLVRAQRPWLMGAIVLLFFVLILGAALFYKNRQKERIAMEAKIREQALAADNAALDRLNRMKSDVIDTISHESRTPLAVLASYAGLVSMELKSKGVDEQTAADLDSIAYEAERVANLIDSMGRISQQKEIASKQTVIDIGELLRQTVRLYEPVIANAGVSPKTNIPDDLPPVFGNPEELTQVLFNLLQNAKNHTERGSISVSAREENGFVAIAVADTGTGIAKELLPNVFVRGVTGGKSTGLGLAICKEVIENHGGTIAIESEINKGTTVRVRLPGCKDGGKNANCTFD